MKSTSPKRRWTIRGAVLAATAMTCVARQLSATDQDTFEKSLEYTRAEMAKHHLISVVYLDGKMSFQSDRYPEVERLQMKDKPTYARKKGKAWLKSEDWAESGTKVTAEEAKGLDLFSFYVDLPLANNALQTKKALAGTKVEFLKRETKEFRELLYYQVLRGRPYTLGDPEYVFTKSIPDIDEKSFLIKFHGVLWPRDNRVMLAVDYFYVEETLAEQKKREKNADPSAVAASDPSQTAWAFFELCASGKCREALESAAPILRARLDVPRLESALAQLGLKTAALFTWKTAKTFHQMATVEGTYTPEPGKVIRLLVTLVRDGAAWRVYSACLGPAGASAPLIPLFAPVLPADAGRAPALPDEKTIRELVQSDLRLFADVQDGDDFRELYRSSGGRARKNPMKTWEWEARLYDRDLTPSRALDAPVHFDEPTTIGPDGVCIAKVHVNIPPLELHFSYRLVLAAEGWQPGGRERQLVPDSSEVQRLSRKALLRFDDAIRRRSFADFHKGVSEAWRAQITPDHLEKAFRPFVEKQIVLEGVASAPILISSAPVENADGLIEFSGRCETTPLRTRFTLKYTHEKGEWRLFGIDVSLPKP